LYSNGYLGISFVINKANNFSQFIYHTAPLEDGTLTVFYIGKQIGRQDETRFPHRFYRDGRPSVTICRLTRAA
jgi:hypothetical protein